MAKYLGRKKNSHLLKSIYKQKTGGLHRDDVPPVVLYPINEGLFSPLISLIFLA